MYAGSGVRIIIMDIEDVKQIIKRDSREVAEVGELLPGRAGIASKVFGTVIDLSEKGRKRKIEVLVAGMCGDAGQESEEALNRLYSCIKNEDDSEYIVELFQQALLSNSKIAIIIMGLQWNSIEKKNRVLDHNELIVFSALCELNDFDIKNFIEIFHNITETPFRERYLNYDIIAPERKTSISLTIDKLVRCNLISEERAHVNGEGYLDLRPIYSLNAFSYRLMELIDSGKRIFEYYHLI